MKRFAVAGSILFTLGWLVLGFISPGYTVFGEHIGPYSPIAQPISGLGLSSTAVAMNTVFIASGLITLVGVLAMGFGRTVTALLSLTPIGLVLVGVFDLEHPAPHLLGAVLIGGAPIASFIAVGIALRRRGRKSLGTWLIVAGPVTLVLFAIYGASFDEATTAANEGVAGLAQRVWFTWVFVWFTVLGLENSRTKEQKAVGHHQEPELHRTER